MDFDDFRKVSLKFWREHLTDLQIRHADGRWDARGYDIYFPNIALTTNCGEFFVFELLGSTRRYQGLSDKKLKPQTIYKYLNYFEDVSDKYLVRLNGGDGGFSYVSLAHDSDFDEVKRRFPILEAYQSFMVRSDGSGSLVEFSDSFDAEYFDHCLFVNKKNNVYRCKNVLALFIFRRGLSASRVKESYNKFIERRLCVHALKGESDALVVCGQFQSIYLASGVHETTIGEFVKLHPDFVCKALGCEDFLYEKSFKWIESKYEMAEDSINPDLLLKRCDGKFDICDLKTVAAAYESITSRKSSRRKFIEYVYDGVAQLNTYKQYFQIPANAKHALDVHGVEVSDPRLILVVGSWENAIPDEVAQASELHPEITFIDYDTLCQLYLSASGYIAKSEK